MVLIKSILLLFPLILFAAPRPAITNIKIKQELNQTKSELKKIKNQIVELENQLGTKNKRFVNIIGKLNKMRNSLQELNDKSSLTQNSIDKQKDKITFLIDRYLMRTLDESEVSSSESLLADELTIKLLLESRNELKELQQSHHSLNSMRDILIKRMKEYQDNERTLTNIINEMEYKKKSLGERYLSNQDKQKQLKTHIAKARAKKQLSNESTGLTPDMKMTTPIKSFAKMLNTKKGVTFKFDDQEPVYTTGAGEITYSGRLANYGKLIMIDHGNEVRSVLLGDFTPKLKKGAKVKKNEILGYTKVGKGQILFQVRKKDKKVDTMKWLDESSLKI